MYLLSDVLKEPIPELRTKKLKPVTVAVIDSGIDSSHEVLRKRVYGAWKFTEENGTITSKELPLNHNNDEAGHGTAVASIIARLAPNARILDFKVLNSKFTSTGRVMIEGLKAAVESDAKVINMSLACLAKYKNEIAQLLELAYQKHKIIIASKRNSVLENDLGFPAELASCISIDNKMYDNNPYYIEHIDEQPIEFAAHGDKVLVAKSGGGYFRMTGTSFATPTTTANVILLLGAYPNLELFEIKSVLKYHSDKNSFRVYNAVNPLEVADKDDLKSKNGVKCLCPDCKKSVKVPEFFSYAKCPECKNIFPLISPSDK